MCKNLFYNSIIYSILILLVLFLNWKCKVHAQSQMSKYARIKQHFPKLTQYEARNYRTALNEDDFKQHPCKRECYANQNMTCYYYMVVHMDETMGPECEKFLQLSYRLRGRDAYVLAHDKRNPNDSQQRSHCKYADGVHSEIMLVNGQLPGQAIEVCEGDTIVADVINSLEEMTTIHWHGLHQRKTPHMDGVPHITQYPIMSGQAFRYRFEVDHAGTNWWHSHTNHQRAFGLAGALVVRQPRALNVHVARYDYDLPEHTFMMQDWVHHFDENVPQNILINGLGHNVQQSGAIPPTIYESFDVVQGARYRFRAIFNGVGNCPISLSIDNHDLVVIATDGNDIEPIVVQKIVFQGAERFDFVLHANRAVRNYWIRVKGYAFCATNKLHQAAVLHYKGAEHTTPPAGQLSYDYEPPNAIELNPYDAVPNKDVKRISIVDATALELRVTPPLMPYHTYYTSMSVYFKENLLKFQMDDITFSAPKVSLLQTRNLGMGGIFCNKSSLAARGRNCEQTNCECPNVITVPAFKYVEFVISANTPSAHPIHLHGYTFRVVGMGTLGEAKINKIAEIDRVTPLQRRKHGGPLKDSVLVPAFGYTIIRFYTDNPGYWIFHCHISPHAENGMAAVLKVGADTQMKLCPVSNCGLCNSVL